MIPDYVRALCDEIRMQKAFADAPAHTVYFGGGTPSRLDAADIRVILETVRDVFELTDPAEITFEMNPCDVSPEYAAALADMGVNRISLGMQSAVPEELKRMGRRHTAEQTAAAVQTLRDAGFRNISLDLIYGYPGQTAESWERSVKAVTGLKPQHVSLYALSVEEGSALRRQLEAGKLSPAGEDETVAMYEYAARTLAENGFEHYEISNWAAASEYESRHNRQYWLVRPYYGFGAGAHGWIDGQRIRNEGNIERYISLVRAGSGRFPAAAEILPQDQHIMMQDVMMLGLRMLNEGITEERFRERFGDEMRSVFRKELRHLEQKGLVYWNTDGRLLLAPDKVMVANQAFIEFVD